MKTIFEDTLYIKSIKYPIHNWNDRHLKKEHTLSFYGNKISKMEDIEVILTDEEVKIFSDFKSVDKKIKITISLED